MVAEFNPETGVFTLIDAPTAEPADLDDYAHEVGNEPAGVLKGSTPRHRIRLPDQRFEIARPAEFNQQLKCYGRTVT